MDSGQILAPPVLQNSSANVNTQNIGTNVPVQNAVQPQVQQDASIPMDTILDASLGEVSNKLTVTFKKTVLIRDYETEVQELQESFDADFNKYFNKRTRKLNEDVDDEEDDYEVVNPLLEMKKLKMPVKKSKTESMRRFRETLSSQSERLRRMEKLLTKN